jgi:glutathione S-transferase
VVSWNSRVVFEGLWAVAEILRNSSPHMKDRALTGAKDFAQIPQLVERGYARLSHFFKLLDERLQETPYIAGEVFSFADITAVVAMDFSKWVKASPDTELKALWAWHENVSKRPSMTA